MTHMTLHAMFLSLVAEKRYRTACDVWESNLAHPATGNQPDATRFRDLRERLGDEAAALDVADAIETAA